MLLNLRDFKPPSALGHSQALEGRLKSCPCISEIRGDLTLQGRNLSAQALVSGCIRVQLCQGELG
jgi:hypothetical protein